jgi:hypothetical protein
MRRADPLCRSLPVVALVLTAAVGLSISLLLFLTCPASPAFAAPEPLSVSVDHALSLVSQPVTVNMSGQLPHSLVGAELSVKVRGPVALASVGQANVEAPEAAVISQVLGRAATPTGTTGTGSASTGTAGTGSASTVTTLAPTTTTTTTASALLHQGTMADLEGGTLEATMTISAGTPAEPGAYLLEVQVTVDGEVLASGQAWVGKVADRDVPLDVAFVLPVSLGIHRDTEGAFFDQALEEAVASTDKNSGLGGLFATFEHLPKWDFTLAIEPILLTQLRDMADGYSGVDSAGARVQVGEDDPRAMEAGATLAAIRELAGQERVQIVVSPYAGADLSVIASEGWRDGLQQIQMGKRELQQTLGLGAPLIGAYSPDLALTSDALAYYAGASVDHVVVSDELIDSLAERVGAGTVTARVSDLENDRVTLVFASDAMSKVMTAPWDGTLFAPSLAAELAATPRDAIVIVSDSAFAVPPASYLENVGEVLTDTDWIRTQTLADLIRVHSPGTRPVLLQTGSAEPGGYIEETLLADLRAAHAAVTDLAASSDATRAPVDTAYRLLAVAESRWWWRKDISPREASIGLDYVARALAVAQGELELVGLSGAGSTFITGNEGVLEVKAQNSAAYPLTVDLRLTGEGVAFPDGESIQVELQPGETELAVRVVRSGGGAHDLTAQLVAGSGVLDELDVSLRFFSFTSMLPWLIAAAAVIAAGVYLVVRRVLRKRRLAKATRPTLPNVAGRPPAAGQPPPTAE